MSDLKEKEKIQTKSSNQLQKDSKNTQNNNYPINQNRNLIMKFRRSFTYPMCFAITINLVVTIFILQSISNKLSNNKDLTTIINELEKDRNEPIIENVGNIIYKKFQPAIFSLISFKKYINHISSEDFLNIEMSHDVYEQEKEHIKKFLKKYSHVIPKKEVFETKEYKEQFTEKHLDRIHWFLNKDKRELDELTEVQIKQLYLITNCILLFKSNFELSKNDTSAGFLNIYGGFDESDLYLKYPPEDKEEFDKTNYKKYVNVTNPSDCRNDQLKIPDYFFFRCRPWYKEATFIDQKQNSPIVITYPYPFFTEIKMVGITVCIKIDINVKDKKNETFKDTLTLCIDMSLSNIISVFDYMNNMINGYFFVLRYDSEKPIYYPKIEEFHELKNLIKYEFDKKSSYYIDELYEYQTEKKKMLNKKYAYKDERKKRANEIIEVSKNGKKMKYTIWPISLNVAENEDDANDNQNLINVIHVTEENLYSETIKIIETNMEKKIIFSILIIIILGLIVLLISVYLINSIAINILKPIKMMNSILIGINKTDEKESNEIVELKKAQKLRNDNSANNQYQKLNNEEENDFENEDDDFLDIRSGDIDSLFQTLIDLKKSLNYLQNDENQESESKMLNLIFAKTTFKKVNENENSGELLLCNSNIGNLSIKLKKYDKAIRHMWDSIKFTHDGYREFSEKLGGLCDNILNRENVFSICGPHGQDKITDMDKKINMESRLPKIIFAYRKFFKEINSLIKKLIYDERLRNIDLTKNLVSNNNKLGELPNEEFYELNYGHLVNNFLNSDYITAKDNFHSLTRFRFVLELYSFQNKDNPRIKILSEFELLEFLIKYVLRPLEYKFENLKTYKESFSNNVKIFMENGIEIEHKNEDLKNNLSLLKNELSKTRKEIQDKINYCTRLVKEDNKDTTEKFLISKKLAKKKYLEYTDLPKAILIQRLNLIKAKFYYKYNIRESFVNLNSILKQNDDIIDGNILIRAYKKMKKIFAKISEILKDYKDNEEALKFLKEEFSNENEAKGSKPNELKKHNMDNNPKNTISNINSEHAINYLQNLSDKAEECINKYNEKLQRFTIDKKDIAVLIDFNHNILDSNKKEKLVLFYENIFREFCTFNDRIALYGYHENPFQLQSLMEKNNKTIKWIESNWRQIFDKKDGEEYDLFNSEENDSELIKAILYVYNNIGKRDIYNNRQKWIIVLTDKISESDLQVFKNDFAKNIYGSKKNENLIIMKYKFENNKNDNEEKEIIEKALAFNKSSGYLELDKKDELKYKMEINGVINESNIFDNEIYNQ